MSNRNHGLSTSSEYRAWNAMLQRCLNPKHPRFWQYGARGIEVCKRWRDSFLNFLDDMGRKPDPRLTLDRTDPSGNYEPANCRWISFDENRRNRTGKYRITEEERHRRSVMGRIYGRMSKGRSRVANNRAKAA